MKQTRNRRKKPPTPLGILSLEAWQADPSMVKWAQSDPNFRLFITMLTTERTQAYLQDGASEQRLLGRSEGYERALQVGLQAAVLARHIIPDQGEPDYPKETETEKVYS